MLYLWVMFLEIFLYDVNTRVDMYLDEAGEPKGDETCSGGSETVRANCLSCMETNHRR